MRQGFVFCLGNPKLSTTSLIGARPSPSSLRSMPRNSWGQQGLYYDNEFRKLRQAIMVPWGMFHTELAHRALQAEKRGTGLPRPPWANRHSSRGQLSNATVRFPAATHPKSILASNTTSSKSAVRDLVTFPTLATSARAHTQYTVAQRGVTRAALRANPPPLPPRPSHGPQPLSPPAQAQLPTQVNPILHGYERHTARTW